MLTLDYLQTGGDSYTFDSTKYSFGAKFSDYRLKYAFAQYLSGEINPNISNICENNIAVYRTTYDGLNSDDFWCIANLNHAFDIEKHEDSMYLNSEMYASPNREKHPEPIYDDLENCFAHFNDKH